MRTTKTTRVVVLAAMVVILCCGVCGTAISQDAYTPKILYFDMGDSSLTGNTPAASGTSVFKIHAGPALQKPESSEVSSSSGTSVVRGFSSLRDGYLAFQITSMTVSQAQQGRGGNYGASTGVSLSGVSTIRIQVYPGLAEYIQAGVDFGGVTLFDKVQMKGLMR
jgi:hypothetical protein